MSATGSGAIAPTFNFSQRVRDGAITSRQLCVFVALALLALFDGMDTQILALMARELTHDLGIPLSSFGAIFSSGLFGAMAGALMLSAPADDWFGRKRVLIVAMVMAGLLTLLTARVTTFSQLIALRFFVGVGLGGAVPNVLSLAAEFSPKRQSRRVVSYMIAVMPLGALLGGVLAHAIMPSSGWRVLLLVAGAGTLGLALLAAAVVPESVQFLVRKKNDQKRAAAAVRKLFPESDIGSVVVEQEAGLHAGQRRQPIKALFKLGYWRLTLLLWIVYAMTQSIMYFIMSWVPVLLQKSGLDPAMTMNAVAMFGVGGAIGTIAQGWITTRFGIYKVMFAEILTYSVGMVILSGMLGNPEVVTFMMFLVSVVISAFFAGLNLLIAESYPEDIRSTAFGWAFGIGRVGASGAPILVGLLVGIGWSPGSLFSAAAVPGIVAALTLTGVGFVHARRARSKDVDLGAISAAE